MEKACRFLVLSLIDFCLKQNTMGFKQNTIGLKQIMMGFKQNLWVLNKKQWVLNKTQCFLLTKYDGVYTVLYIIDHFE